MPTTLAQIETLARKRLIEATPRFWTSAELIDIVAAGCRDLWRDIVDLKQEYYLTINDTDVVYPANSGALIGVPNDIHKIYMIEPRDISENSANPGVNFRPQDWNHVDFQAARSRTAVEGSSVTLYYAITGQGAPVGAPVIRVAPRITGAMNVTLAYVPTLGPLVGESIVPVPGEADNALVAWTVAFALAKQSEDKSPDANWLSVYSTEKDHLLQSLGLRQLQEPQFVEGVFAEYW